MSCHTARGTLAYRCASCHDCPISFVILFPLFADNLLGCVNPLLRPLGISEICKLVARVEDYIKGHGAYFCTVVKSLTHCTTVHDRVIGLCVVLVEYCKSLSSRSTNSRIEFCIDDGLLEGAGDCVNQRDHFMQKWHLGTRHPLRSLEKNLNMCQQTCRIHFQSDVH